MSRITLHYIDYCFMDYLTDHHSRDGEGMLGVAVDNTMTLKDLVDEICDKSYSVAIPDNITEDMVRKAVEKEVYCCCQNIQDRLVSEEYCFDIYENEDCCDPENPYMWFYFEWELDEKIDDNLTIVKE